VTNENGDYIKWSFGTVPLSWQETHDKVVKMMEKEPRGKVLDIPTGTGILADRLRRKGFDVYCCDINPSFFSIPDLSLQIGDLNHSIPYLDNFFDYLVSIDGIEHTENPSNAIREFVRVLKKGGKIFLTTANFLNIERRFRYLFRGSLSKIPSHQAIKNKGDLSLAHISPLVYPLLKFIMEYNGFRILRVEKEKVKPRMKWLLPIVWIIRFYGLFLSRETREFYRLNETESDVIIMGGNSVIIVGEKVV